jgi:hypothetical protein
MCDKIQEGDERNQSTIIQQDDCIKNENKLLENCLKDNNHDWRKCSNQLKELKKCYSNKNNQAEASSQNKFK